MNQDNYENNVVNNEIETSFLSEPSPHNKQPRKRRFGKSAKVLSFLLAGALILGSGFGAGYGTATLVISSGLSDQVQRTGTLGHGVVKPVVFTGEMEGDYVTPVTGIEQVAGPSIVTVISVKEQLARGFFSNQLYESEGTGSGVIYKVTEDGVLIMTER